jgi:hypothetical protein
LRCRGDHVSGCIAELPLRAIEHRPAGDAEADPPAVPQRHSRAAPGGRIGSRDVRQGHRRTHRRTQELVLEKERPSIVPTFLEIRPPLAPFCQLPIGTSRR